VGFAIVLGVLLGFLIDASNRPVIYIAEARTVEVMPEEPQKVLIEVKIDWTKERIEQEIRTASDKYGVSYDKMYHTIKCESGFNIKIRSQHFLSYGQEDSWGLAQFHLPSRNRDASGTIITRDMALDPVQALDAMAFHFSKGNARAWTCHRNLYQ